MKSQDIYIMLKLICLQQGGGANYLNLENSDLIISTDGYWADLDVQEKANFINGGSVWTKPLQDDAVIPPKKNLNPK